MRSPVKTELAIIQANRPMLDRVLIRLFPGVFNRFACAHILRAKEVMDIHSTTMHNMTHFVGADCGLPGYGAPKRKEPLGWFAWLK